jgi:hypothetical protein
MNLPAARSHRGDHQLVPTQRRPSSWPSQRHGHVLHAGCVPKHLTRQRGPQVAALQGAVCGTAVTSRFPAGSALGASPTPGDWPPASLDMFLLAARRYAVSATARGQSVRVARPTVSRSLHRSKITVKGAPAARQCFAPQTLEQCSCPVDPLAPVRLGGAE